VVWGVALPSTLEEIAFFEALPPMAAAEALEQQRKAKEKAAREAEERRREHEKYLSSKQPPPASELESRVTSTAASDFWSKGEVEGDVIQRPV
jgi:hypothetical protein